RHALASGGLASGFGWPRRNKFEHRDHEPKRRKCREAAWSVWSLAILGSALTAADAKGVTHISLGRSPRLVPVKGRSTNGAIQVGLTPISSFSPKTYLSSAILLLFANVGLLKTR